MKCLTTEFGMESGVPTSLWPPKFFNVDFMRLWRQASVFFQSSVSVHTSSKKLSLSLSPHKIYIKKSILYGRISTKFWYI